MIDCGLESWSDQTKDYTIGICVYNVIDCGLESWSDQTKDYTIGICVYNVIDCGLEFWSDQTKDYTIGICGFFPKHATFRRESKTVWLEIRIISPSEEKSLLPNTDFLQQVEDYDYLQTDVSVS